LGSFKDAVTFADYLDGEGGWPNSKNAYPKPSSIPDYHVKWENDFEYNIGKDSDLHDFLDDKTWPSQPIQDILTPEQKKILQRYKDLDLNLVPDDWKSLWQKTKDDLLAWTSTFPGLDSKTVKAEYDKPKEIHTDYDQIKSDLNLWTTTFPLLSTNQVRVEYDKPKEVHQESDLKPKDLPSDWKTQIANSTILQKRLNSIANLLKIIISQKVKVEKK
jgi:hypothetical protein